MASYLRLFSRHLLPTLENISRRSFSANPPKYDKFPTTTSSYWSRKSKMISNENPSSSPDSINYQGTDDQEINKFKSTLDDESRRLLEIYMAEYEIFKYADSRMPSKMTVGNWRRLLLMDSKTERIQYLTFLFDTEKRDMKDRMSKLKARAEAPEIIEVRRAEIKKQRDEHIYYGIGGSSLFRRILDSDMHKHMNSRLAQAMIFGPHIIFDMSFLPIMRPVEVSLTAKQLLQTHHDNRAHRFPHHILFTGCNRKHASWEDIDRAWVDSLASRLYTVTEKHYLDLYPRERLVYLSPDAKLALNEYDAEKIYIVAGCVDRIAKPNLTLGRAKEEGIEARRLPLERCVRLVGGKSLCLNHIVAIMNDAHACGSITTAIINNLPKRKVVPRCSITAKDRRELTKQRLNYLRTVGTAVE